MDFSWFDFGKLLALIFFILVIFVCVTLFLIVSSGDASTLEPECGPPHGGNGFVDLEWGLKCLFSQNNLVIFVGTKATSVLQSTVSTVVGFAFPFDFLSTNVAAMLCFSVLAIVSAMCYSVSDFPPMKRLCRNGIKYLCDGILSDECDDEDYEDDCMLIGQYVRSTSECVFGACDCKHKFECISSYVFQ
eukprot:TRINITY_DN2726_c0_g1_i1.p1 TRINITY_DN2726_c0_g1~~TRINITY_DN2726_c0_g1_i1.p1  ORF type:complete len:205 (-),score=32.01 TRINITY_DN2726_c0_g1_i1:320-886(-)